MSTWAVFQDFIGRHYNPLARQVKFLTDADRRNFEGYITAKVIFNILNTVPGFKWVYIRELNKFLDKTDKDSGSGMVPPVPDKKGSDIIRI